MWPVKLILIWNVICIARGFFVAENYWEWKHLINTSFTLLLPLVAYLATNRRIFQKLVSSWLKYMLLIFFLFIPFVVRADFVGRFMVPIMFLLLFLPVLPKKWKWIVLFYTTIVLISGLDARSNIIRFTFAFVLGITFYFKLFKLTFIFKSAHLVLFASPLLLLFLAATNTFNIFRMEEYISGSYSTSVTVDGETSEESLTADTRTFLYAEVIGSAIKNNYVLTGRTPARGYDSEFFGYDLAKELKTGKMERFGSEVSIHNIFTYTGLIGVLLYFLIFFRSSYLAIYRSNNFYMKIVGLFIAFRWLYAFVEDFSNFDLQYFFLWMIIGMGFSEEFRSMTDQEFRIWIKSLFSQKYLFPATDNATDIQTQQA